MLCLTFLARFLDRVRLGEVGRAFGQVRETLIARMEQIEVGLTHFFNIDQAIAHPLKGGNDFIKLELDGERILVLRPLNEKDQ